MGELEERVRRLERANRRLAMALAATAAAVFGIAALGAVQDRQEIKARRFVVVDDQGRERSVWGTRKGQDGRTRLGLDFLHAGGEDAGGIGVSPNGNPFLLLKHARNESRISALVGRDGRGSIEILGPKGEALAEIPENR